MIMHVFELAYHVKDQRGLCTYLDGERSLKRLRSFLIGYEAGVSASHGNLTGLEDFHTFNSWVAKRIGFIESTSGWCNMIFLKAGSDEKAFNLFFELLDEFLQYHP